MLLEEGLIKEPRWGRKGGGRERREEREEKETGFPRLSIVSYLKASLAAVFSINPSRTMDPRLNSLFILGAKSIFQLGYFPAVSSLSSLSLFLILIMIIVMK